MTAKFWTKNGEDMWKLKERRVFDFTNLETSEVVSCDLADVLSAPFVPVMMPKVKPQTNKALKKKKAKSSPRRKESSTRKKSKYKGVSPSKTPGKFRGQFWDKKNNRNVGLGTFDSELLAAAAYQEAAGNKKEAIRLRNEYEEGDRSPEMEPDRNPDE